MEGIKGFTKDLTATRGKGIFRFAPGQTYEEPECSTRKNGFHFVEYAPDCLDFYPLGQGNRYFVIEAEDVDEENGAVCCCHRMTLVKELTLLGFAGRAMMYMVINPRMDWERNMSGYTAARDRACTQRAGTIAIARGPQPVASGAPGSVLGLLREDAAGGITAARVFETKDGRSYTLTEKGEIEEEQA